MHKASKVSWKGNFFLIHVASNSAKTRHMTSDSVETCLVTSDSAETCHVASDSALVKWLTFGESLFQHMVESSCNIFDNFVNWN